jgi:hypothetical protein
LEVSDDMQNTDVISAFLDNEAFEPRELASALSEADGRQTLLQLIALRHIVQLPGAEASTPVRSPRRPSSMWLRAAVLLFALGAGFALGTSVRSGHQASTVGQSTPPVPTIVVHQAPDSGWEPVKRGE